jgi:hypothetical protein
LSELREGQSIAGVVLNFDARTITQMENGKPVTREVSVCTLAELDDARSNAVKRPAFNGREFEFIVSADMRGKIKPGIEGHYICATKAGKKRVPNGEMQVFDVIISDDNFFQTAPAG